MLNITQKAYIKIEDNLFNLTWKIREKCKTNVNIKFCGRKHKFGKF
jgi:hypothetical protein